MKKLIFSTLAMNQTTFWVGVAEALKSQGFESTFLCFHERSEDYVKEHGFPAYNVFKYIPQHGEDDVVDAEFLKTVEDLGIENAARMISHERVFFNINRSANVKRKFCDYAHSVRTILEEIACPDTKGEQPVLIQELGGFTSVLSTFYVARKLNIDNIFVEPSVFRGRFLFIENSLEALPISDSASEVAEEVKGHIERIIRERQPVIPTKDAWQYNNPLKKLLRPRNFKRLAEKTADKYIFNKKEEFGYIGNYVSKHAKMLMNRALLNSSYGSVPEQPFIYFPLHVPTDMALTIRSPEYLDQYALIDYLARNIPVTHKLAFKEHPALVGAVDRERIRSLLLQNDNVVFIHPSVANYEIIDRADLIVTVNSKTGAEALLCGKNVVVLGDAFYGHTRLVTRAAQLADLPKAIRIALSKRNEKKEIYRFFQSVWDVSHPGEIFGADSENYRQFSNSIVRYLSDRVV